jgi:hypothetical protein
MLPTLGSLEGAEGLWRVRERRGVDTNRIGVPFLSDESDRRDRSHRTTTSIDETAIRCRGAVNGIEDTRDQGDHLRVHANSHRGGDVGIQRVKDDQRRGDGDWKTR